MISLLMMVAPFAQIQFVLRRKKPPDQSVEAKVLVGVN
jgi:hypothetical protein